MAGQTEAVAAAGPRGEGGWYSHLQQTKDRDGLRVAEEDDGGGDPPLDGLGVAQDHPDVEDKAEQEERQQQACTVVARWWADAAGAATLAACA